VVRDHSTDFTGPVLPVQPVSLPWSNVKSFQVYLVLGSSSHLILIAPVEGSGSIFGVSGSDA
jgi:hypothetical protein